jgi:hypothetical protein
MMHTIAGLFENHRTADLVVEHLVQEYGIPRERVRVHARRRLDRRGRGPVAPGQRSRSLPVGPWSS